MVDQPFQFRASGLFMLRTPRLAFDEFARWAEGAPGRPASAAELDAALGTLRARLLDSVSRDAVKQALELASPALTHDLPRWASAPLSEHGARIEAALVRYVSRMCTRATPFGLFAGVAFGALGAKTEFELTGVRPHVQLSTRYAVALARAFATSPQVGPQLRYLPNPTLAEVRGRLVFQATELVDDRIVFQEQQADLSPYLSATLARAAEGEAAQVLAAALARDAEVSNDEAVQFVSELAAAQVLVPELRPSVTETDPLPRLVAGLPTGPHREALERAADRLRLGQVDLSAALGELPVRLEPARAVKVDLQLLGRATLGRDVASELLRGARALYALQQPRADRSLEGFCQEFERRYEEREVPLLEALDPEVGLEPPGEVSPRLLDGLAFEPPSEPWDSAGPSRVVIDAALDAIASGRRELVLQEEELPRQWPGAAPDAFAVWAVVGAERCWLRAVDGPSGVDALGRFASMEEEWHHAVRAHLEAEEALWPELVFAEVVHLPSGAADNIVSRPALRQYEIAIGSNASVPADRRLPLSDLLLSVRSGRLTLRSKRLGREVMPSLCNAHDIRRDLSRVYRVLCLIRQQGNASVAWSWGPLAGAPFLPRVCVGKTVLAPQTWTVKGEALQRLTTGSALERHQATQQLRDDLGWPRFVSFGKGDQVLLVDLDNLLSVGGLLAAAKKGESLTLQEALPVGSGPVQGPGGNYTNEVVVPFVRQRPPAHRAVQPGVTGARRFAPGSAWTYLKLYCGSKTGDEVLEALRPTLQALRLPWFFVRYRDPERHLRVRLHGGSPLVPLLAALEPLLQEQRVWKVQLDTYERELERYGGEDGMRLAEAVFVADSALVMELLETLRGADELDRRFKLALVSTHRLLIDLGLDPHRRLAAAKRARGMFAAELGGGAAMEKGLSDRYRGLRSEVEAMVAHPAPGGEAFDRRSDRLRPITAELTALAGMGRLAVTLDEFASHCVHMASNRMLRSSARAQELVLCDFLTRAYGSALARAGSGT